MNQKQVTESVMAEFTPVFKAMIKTSPGIAKIYDALHNGVHPAQVIESLSYQIIRLQAHLETLQNIGRIEVTPAPPVLRTEKPDAKQDTDWNAVSPDVILSMQSVRVHEYPDAAMRGINEGLAEVKRMYQLFESPESFKARQQELNRQLSEGIKPVRERDTLHVCYYCGQRPPVTLFDNFDICGPCSEFLTGMEDTNVCERCHARPRYDTTLRGELLCWPCINKEVTEFLSAK